MENEDAILHVAVDAAVRDVLRAAGVRRLEVRLSASPGSEAAAPPRGDRLEPDLDRAVEAFLESEARALAGFPAATRAIALQAALLEAFDVPAGAKAQAIFLHAVWTDERARRHGPAVNVHTLRRWRASARRQVQTARERIDGRRGGAGPGTPIADDDTADDRGPRSRSPA